MERLENDLTQCDLRACRWYLDVSCLGDQVCSVSELLNLNSDGAGGMSHRARDSAADNPRRRLRAQSIVRQSINLHRLDPRTKTPIEPLAHRIRAAMAVKGLQ